MVAQRTVIATVGTSLVSNRRPAGSGGSIAIGRLDTACDALAQAAGGNQDVTDERARVLDLLEHGDLAPTDQVGLRGDPQALRNNQRDRLPQELSYLFLLLRDEVPDQAAISVHLLASDSVLGEACAWIVQQYLENRRKAGDEPWCKLQAIECETIAGLQTECPERFRKQGAPGLIQRIRELAMLGGDGPVIVNPTGGFKELIPYAVIATALLDREYEVHYLFQDSRRIARLPAYPIGLDFPLWHREENVRRAGAHWEGYREALDFRMRSVVQSADADAPALAIFEEEYLRQANTDPFVNYSRSAIGRLLTGRAPQYGERLEKLLEGPGPSIWLGDKIEMAAGHAAEHHHDLLEVAELLLLPMLAADPQTLGDEELFVLLSAVLLHDCGHTVGAVPGPGGALLTLFPSEVRRLHHFLTFHRLTEHGEELDWDPSAPLAKEVAYLCLYHRRSTGWMTEKPALGDGYCPFLEMRLVPPLRAAEEYGLDKRLDFPKLVALLRLIDGCDNQSRRVGTAQHAAALGRIFARDRLAHMARMHDLANACLNLMELLPEETPLPGARFIAEIAAHGRGDAPHLPQVDMEVRYCLAGEGGALRPWAELWTETARARDEVAIRDRQYIHFLKHQAVQRILVHPDGDFSAKSRRYRITLVPDSAHAAELDSPQLAQDYAEIKAATLREWVLQEVASEIMPEPDAAEGPADYLAQALGGAIQFQFCWQDRPEGSITVPAALPRDPA